jgi:hypothetical protein
MQYEVITYMTAEDRIRYMMNLSYNLKVSEQQLDCHIYMYLPDTIEMTDDLQQIQNIPKGYVPTIKISKNNLGFELSLNLDGSFNLLNKLNDSTRVLSLEDCYLIKVVGTSKIGFSMGLLDEIKTLFLPMQ